MRIGLALPQYDYAAGRAGRLEWDTVLAWARHAERLGFDSLWLADHLFLSVEKYGGPAGEHFGYDPVPALAGLARATGLTVGTLVLCSQLRPARLAAAQLATVARLAPGGLVAGVGAGWYEPEYAAAGIPFGPPRQRLGELADAADALRERLGPEGVPVWVGGKGDRLLDVVARHADGWNTVWAWTEPAYRERLAVLDAACERAGRDPASVTRSLGLYALVGDGAADLARRFERLRAITPPGVLDGVTLDGWRSGRLVGTVEEVRAQAEAWADLGVALLIVGLGAVPFTMTDPDDLDLVASALL